MRRLAEQARLAVQTTVPVLLVGEPGTGKQTLARFIHYQGPMRERPFAAIDCVRLPLSALEEVLFGDFYSRLGTVYLREPSRLPRNLQLKVCAALAGDRSPSRRAAHPGRLRRRSRPGDWRRTADPRIVCVAGRADRASAAAGARLDDLPALVGRLLERCNEEGEPRVRRLAPDVWDVLAHPWPGNLRKLYAVLSAARRHAGGERITAADLPASLRLLRRMEETPGRRPERPLPLDALLEQAERRLIEMALQRAGGKRHRAAEILAIWKARLIRRMKALGLGNPEGDDAGEK